MKSDTISPEAGKHYRLRDGTRYRCYATDSEYVHGARQCDDGTWIPTSHDKDGEYTYRPSCHDIIAEWVDKPEVNWPAMPAWAVAVAKDSRGPWYWYTSAPDVPENEDSWLARDSHCGIIPPPYEPTFSGHWRESRVLRPS